MTALRRTPLVCLAIAAGLTPLAVPSTPVPGSATRTLDYEPTSRVLTLEGATMYPGQPTTSWNEIMTKLCDEADSCRAVDYPSYASVLGMQPGADSLTEALAESDDKTTVFAYSSGTMVTWLWLAENRFNPDAPDPDNVEFLQVGNVFREQGGTLGFLTALLPESQYHVTDVTRQYDWLSDFPTYPFNLVALANAALGYTTVHVNYHDVDLEDPANNPDYVSWTEGNTTYVFVPTENLPLLEPLRALGYTDLADQLNGPLKIIVEDGYDRNLPETDGDPTGVAGHSTFNIPQNLVNALLSVPANEILALRELTAALNQGGSWFTYTPTHVQGFDPADAAKVAALTKVLIPFPALSEPLGALLNTILIAELPMNAGCTGLPGPCPDPEALFSGYFQVPITDLLSGVTFDDDLVNPVDGTPLPWAGQTQRVDPLAPALSVFDALTAPQSGLTTVTPQQVVTTGPELADSLWTSFNPLTPGSFVYGPPWPVPLDSTEFTWFDSITGSAAEEDMAQEDADVQSTLVDDVQDADSEPELEPEVEAESASEAEPETEADADNDTEADADSAADADTDTHADSDGARPGRHRTGISVQRIFDRITGSADRDDADRDDSDRDDSSSSTTASNDSSSNSSSSNDSSSSDSSNSGSDD